MKQLFIVAIAALLAVGSASPASAHAPVAAPTANDQPFMAYFTAQVNYRYDLHPDTTHLETIFYTQTYPERILALRNTMCARQQSQGTFDKAGVSVMSDYFNNTDVPTVDLFRRNQSAAAIVLGVMKSTLEDRPDFCDGNTATAPAPSPGSSTNGASRTPVFLKVERKGKFTYYHFKTPKDMSADSTYVKLRAIIVNYRDDARPHFVCYIKNAYKLPANTKTVCKSKTKAPLKGTKAALKVSAYWGLQSGVTVPEYADSNEITYTFR